MLVDDDGPTAAITDTGVTVTHDETAGVQADTDQAGAVPTVFATGDGLPATAIGWAQSAGAVVSTAGTAFGTDGAAATDSAVWSLTIPNLAGTDSGLNAISGADIILFVEEHNGEMIIVGREGGAAGAVVLAVSITQTGLLQVVQYGAVEHLPNTTADQTATMLDTAIQAVLTVTDADGDTHVDTEYIGDKVNIQDDGPTGEDIGTETLEEDDLANALSTGNNEDASVDAHTATIDLSDGVTSTGADAPLSYNLDDIDPDTVLPALLSKGEAVDYELTLDDASMGGADVIRAWVDKGGAGERLVFTFSVSSVGAATLTLNDQLDHAAGGGENTALLLAGGGTVSVIDFSAMLLILDADNDPLATEAGFLTYAVQDDVPVLTGGTESGSVDEDDLQTALSDGSDTGTNPLTATGDLSALVTAGTDEPAAWSLLVDTSGLPALSSKGVALSYAVVGDTLTATAGAITVFTLVLDGDGTYTYTQFDQLDHATGNGQSSLTIDFSSVVQAADYDDDTIGLPASTFEITVVDDISAIGPIANSTIDFASGESATKTLNGVIGADENNATNLSAAGTKTYTFTSYSGDTSGNAPAAVPGLLAELSSDATTVTYYVDGDGVAGFTAGDTKYYDVVLDQTNGTYTFSVYQNPPPAELNFDFDGFPSGKQIYGVFGAKDQGGVVDPDGPAILVFGEGVNLVTSGTKAGQAVVGGSAGHFVNSSNAQNSGTALAIDNQTTDSGEGMFIAYVDDPEADTIVVGVGSSSQLTTAYGDADYLNFAALMPSNGAEVDISQVTPNGSLVDLQITAYSAVVPVSGGTDADGVDTDAEAYAFLQNPLTGASQEDIVEVIVRDGGGTILEHWALTGGAYVAEVDDAVIDVDFIDDGSGNHSAIIYNAADNYSIEFITADEHNLALVENVDTDGDGFDIGGFNITEAQPTPDQKFDFTVQITDFDGDTDTASFSVSLDGTGLYDNDAVAGV
nr:DUF5801 repeats-in-toxin domain-containing protein [Defluviimonas sediminis]